MSVEAPTEREAWALEALLKAGYGAVAVYRVYAPYDSQDPIEVLFVTTTGCARTGFMNAQGQMLGTLHRW